MLPKNRIPTHPGETLLEEYLIPMGLSQVKFAAHIGVPVQRINEIVRGKRKRCQARYYGITSGARFDSLFCVREKDRLYRKTVPGTIFRCTHLRPISHYD